jgi:uncharacterized protein involved in outer membrane biogenesis
MSISKLLKKTGKVLLISLLSLLLLILVVVVIALNSENTITRLALKEVSTMIEAPVKVDNVSLLLFRKFPYATVEFDGFKLGAHAKSGSEADNAELSDTLVSLGKLYVSLKTRPLLRNKIEIKKIEIEGLSLNYLVDSKGATNIDFLMATDSTTVTETDTTETALDVLLSDLTIRDVRVKYSDQQMKASATIHIPEMDISGRMLNSYYAGKVRGIVNLSNVDYEGININLMEKASLGFMIDYVDGNLTIDSLTLATDGAQLSANGKATLGDSIFVDMAFALTELNLKEVSKYATPEMLKEYGLVEIEGQMKMDAKINGYVYDTLLLPQVQANMSLKRGFVKTTDYPEIKHISFNGTVAALDPNDLTTATANFKDFRVATQSSYIDMAFNASNFDKPAYDVKTSGHINFDEFSSFIPDSTVEYLTGTMAFNLATRGILPDDLGMNSADYFLERTSLDVKVVNLSTALDSVDEVKNLNINFAYRPNKKITIKNLSLDAPGYGVALQNSSLSGTLLGFVRDMDNMGIDLDSYFIQMGNNTIEGKTYVKGLENVTFRTDTRANIDLDELRPFIPDSLVESISGKIIMNLTSFGSVHLDSIEDQMMPIAFEQSKIDVQVRNFNFEMFDDTLSQVQNLSLDFSMVDDTIRIDNLFGHAHGIDFWMDSTQVWNAYKAFLLEQKDQTLIVQTNIKLGDLDYAPFAYLVETDSTQLDSIPPPTEAQQSIGDAKESKRDSTQEEEEMYIPPYIVRGTMAVNSVKYGDILMNNLSTHFRVDEKLYVIDKFKFDAFGGSMISSAVYDTRDDSLTNVFFKNEIFGMDIHQMLVDGENFGQEDFTHENISGKLTSSVDGRIQMQDTTILYDKINLRGNFKLEDGGIYNFEPAMELAKFTNLRELDNIVFRTLESSIYIYGNNIYFPKTDIVSTAVDISAMGMQSFGDDYQYHLNVFLSDVLLGKSDKLLEKQGMEKDGFGGDDGSSRKGLRLVSLKRGEETKHGFDNKRLNKIMSTTIRVNERGLNLIFNPRLVSYNTNLDRGERAKDEAEDEVEQ